jgi:hypothetical protein
MIDGFFLTGHVREEDRTIPSTSSEKIDTQMELLDVIPYTTIVSTCATAGAVTGLWHVLLRVKRESEAERADRQFSYYDVLDAVQGTIWGGIIGGAAAITAPLSLPVYAMLCSIRDAEDRAEQPVLDEMPLL